MLHLNFRAMAQLPCCSSSPDSYSGWKTHIVWISLALAVLPGVALTGCTEKVKPPTPTLAAPNSEPAAIPSTNVLGVAPADPTRDSAASRAPAKSDMSQAQQSNAMPMAGQANDHSVLGPKPVEKPPNR